jgi:hypothetical protein
MNGWFDNDGFNTFYRGKSKYAKKEQLLDSFYYTWNRINGPFYNYPQFTYNWKKYWTADVKKKMKVILLGYGYTSAGIDGLFKAFTEWNTSALK